MGATLRSQWVADNFFMILYQTATCYFRAFLQASHMMSPPKKEPAEAKKKARKGPKLKLCFYLWQAAFEFYKGKSIFKKK
jgi:hypothetical protein